MAADLSNYSSEHPNVTKERVGQPAAMNPEFMWLLNRFIEEYGIVKFQATYIIIVVFRDIADG